MPDCENCKFWKSKDGVVGTCEKTRRSAGVLTSGQPYNSGHLAWHTPARASLVVLRRYKDREGKERKIPKGLDIRMALRTLASHWCAMWRPKRRAGEGRWKKIAKGLEQPLNESSQSPPEGEVPEVQGEE